MESFGKKWLKRYGRKVQATILGIEEKHHIHDENEDCCGPDMTYLLTAKANDSSEALFEKHLWINEKEKIGDKKQIIIYIKHIFI